MKRVEISAESDGDYPLGLALVDLALSTLLGFVSIFPSISLVRIFWRWFFEGTWGPLLVSDRFLAGCLLACSFGLARLALGRESKEDYTPFKATLMVLMYFMILGMCFVEGWFLARIL